MGFFAQMFLSRFAHRTRIATNPGIDNTPLTQGDIFDLWAMPDNFTFNFMAKREGQLATVLNVEFFIVAQAELSILQVNIRMANTTMMHPYQHLSASGFGCFCGGFTQRCPILNN